jgi:hypothetical protein
MFEHHDRELVAAVHRLQGELMGIAQVIVDAQARLETAIAANSTKVDALIAAVAAGGTPDPTSATAAEQAQIADAINASAAEVEAINAKS